MCMPHQRKGVLFWASSCTIPHWQTSNPSTPCRSIVIPVTNPYPPYVQHVLSQHFPVSIYSTPHHQHFYLNQNKTSNRYSHRSSRMIISQSWNPTRSLNSPQLSPRLHLLHVLLSRSWSHWLWSLWCEAFPVTASWRGGVHFFLNVGDTGSHFDS